MSFNEYFSIHARSEASTDSGLVHALCAPQTQKPINLKQLLDPVPPPQICAKTCFCFSKNSRGRTGIALFQGDRFLRLGTAKLVSSGPIRRGGGGGALLLLPGLRVPCWPLGFCSVWVAFGGRWPFGPMALASQHHQKQQQ